MAADTDAELEAFRQFERDGWERIAQSYHELASTVTRALVDDLLDAAEVGPGSTLLDVACGPGYAAAAAAARGASSTGCDLAESMVALAHQLYPELDVRHGDVRALPFEDGGFDVVVSHFGLPHFPHPEANVAELVRLVAPGGRVALTTWGAPTENPLFGILYAAMQEGGATPPDDLPSGPDPFAYAEEADLERLLRGAGLEAVTVRAVATEVTGQSEDLWKGFLHGTVRSGAVLGSQSEAVQQRVREIFNRRVSTFCGSRGIELPAVAKVAVGRKP